jgi:hypothetical protein
LNLRKQLANHFYVTMATVALNQIAELTICHDEHPGDLDGLILHGNQMSQSKIIPSIPSVIKNEAANIKSPEEIEGMCVLS